MGNGCRLCRSNRQVCLSRAGVKMIFGETLTASSSGNLPPVKLARLRGGVAGVIQVAIAESMIKGRSIPGIWLCRDCGYWEAEC